MGVPGSWPQTPGYGFCPVFVGFDRKSWQKYLILRSNPTKWGVQNWGGTPKMALLGVHFWTPFLAKNLKNPALRVSRNGPKNDPFWGHFRPLFWPHFDPILGSFLDPILGQIDPQNGSKRGPQNDPKMGQNMDPKWRHFEVWELPGVLTGNYIPA